MPIREPVYWWCSACGEELAYLLFDQFPVGGRYFASAAMCPVCKEQALKLIHREDDLADIRYDESRERNEET